MTIKLKQFVTFISYFDNSMEIQGLLNWVIKTFFIWHIKLGIALWNTIIPSL